MNFPTSSVLSLTLSGSLYQQVELYEFIRALRALCGSMPYDLAVDKYILDVVGGIRQSLSDRDLDRKAIALSKLYYLWSLGYDIRWASFSVVELLNHPLIIWRQLAYLMCSCIFDSSVNVSLLACSSLKRQLVSSDFRSSSCALSSFSSFSTLTICNELQKDITGLISHENDLVRKKAVIALQRIASQNLKVGNFDVFMHVLSHLRNLLSDGSSGVVGRVIDCSQNLMSFFIRSCFKKLLNSGLIKDDTCIIDAEVAHEEGDINSISGCFNEVFPLLFKEYSAVINSFLELTPRIFKILSNDSQSIENWILLKGIKFLQIMTFVEPRLVAKVEPLVKNLMNSSAVVIQVAALQYILYCSVPSDSVYYVMALNKLHEFVDHADQNLSFIGYELLATVCERSYKNYSMQSFIDIVKNSSNNITHNNNTNNTNTTNSTNNNTNTNNNGSNIDNINNNNNGNVTSKFAEFSFPYYVQLDASTSKIDQTQNRNELVNLLYKVFPTLQNLMLKRIQIQLESGQDELFVKSSNPFALRILSITLNSSNFEAILKILLKDITAGLVEQPHATQSLIEKQRQDTITNHLEPFVNICIFCLEYAEKNGFELIKNAKKEEQNWYIQMMVKLVSDLFTFSSSEDLLKYKNKINTLVNLISHQFLTISECHESYSSSTRSHLILVAIAFMRKKHVHDVPHALVNAMMIVISKHATETILPVANVRSQIVRALLLQCRPETISCIVLCAVKLMLLTEQNLDVKKSMIADIRQFLIKNTIKNDSNVNNSKGSGNMDGNMDALINSDFSLTVLLSLISEMHEIGSKNDEKLIALNKLMTNALYKKKSLLNSKNLMHSVEVQSLLKASFISSKSVSCSSNSCSRLPALSFTASSSKKNTSNETLINFSDKVVLNNHASGGHATNASHQNLTASNHLTLEDLKNLDDLVI